MPTQNREQLPFVNDQLKQCRICLDDDNLDDIISPCLCSGSSAYVHRTCLNNWRAENLHGRGFKFCNVCRFEYVIENVLYDDKTERKRYMKYTFLVIRDSTAFILFVQSVIIGLAFIIKIILENNKNTIDENANSIIPFIYYYFGTLFMIFFIVGYFYLFKDCHGLSGFNINCDSDVVKAIMFILICIAILICTTIGLFAGIYHSAMILEKIMTRHKNKLWLRQETEISIVKDFQGRRKELEEYLKKDSLISL